MFLCIDEYHYIMSAGCHFRREFYESTRVLVGRLWEKCSMLFCSATMHKVSMFYCSMMLHPQSIYKSSKYSPSEIGLDNPIIRLPFIDLLPTKFFTAIVWGNVGREGINSAVKFSTNWVKSVTPPLIVYITQRCKVMGY